MEAPLGRQGPLGRRAVRKSSPLQSLVLSVTQSPETLQHDALNERWYAREAGGQPRSQAMLSGTTVALVVPESNQYNAALHHQPVRLYRTSQ